MEIFYRVLEVINWIMIGISILCFSFQIIMILFCWLKEKKFPETEKKNKIAVIICGRDEEASIGETVRDLLNKQNYPKDLFDVYVVADNCTDKTAEVARKAGAIVYEHIDEDKAHHKVAYPLKFGLKKILEEKKYDFVIRFDADNKANDNYLSKMNDAYNAGVLIARPFEGSKNPDQNIWTSVSFNYYCRDSRIASNFRERCHMDSMLTGAGMMVATSILEECDAWDAMSSSEDAEFTINRLVENKRVHYVSEAVVYEDQPSTMKDTYHRLARMGKGLFLLFFRKGFKLFGHFFKSGKPSNIDLFVQLLMVVFSFLAFAWFVPYYVFYAICHIINFSGCEWLSGISGLNGIPMTAEYSYSEFIKLLWLAGIVLGSFVVIYPLQSYLAVRLSKKTLGYKSIKPYLLGIIISPLFMMFYGISIFLGIFSKGTWKKINRNS